MQKRAGRPLGMGYIATKIGKNNWQSRNGIAGEADGLNCSECSTVLKRMICSFLVLGYGSWFGIKERKGNDCFSSFKRGSEGKKMRSFK